MNIEDSGLDTWTCPKCGKKNYFEVGMSFCGCSSWSGRDYDDEPENKPGPVVTPRGYSRLAHSSVPAPSVTMPFEFIQHSTAKAILFCMLDEHGAYMKWIPRSVIEHQNDEAKTVTVPRWFTKV